jgi:hypothetical protein
MFARIFIKIENDVLSDQKNISGCLNTFIIHIVPAQI